MSTTHLFSAPDEALRLPHGIVRTASGSKSVAVFAELRFPHRTHLLMDGLLDDPIEHVRDAQRAHPSVGFGDFHRPDCSGPVGPGFAFGFDRFPVLADRGFGSPNVHSINSGRTAIGFHPQPCSPQVFPSQHSLERRFLFLFFRHLLLAPPSARVLTCPPRLGLLPGSTGSRPLRQFGN